jgi:hypothetical protein
MAVVSTEFISQAITPERGSFTTELMTQGLAALPAAFTWAGRRYEIVECLEHHKRTSPEGGSGERYLRRQEFVVRLDTGQTAVIYVLRQATRGSDARSAGKRWFLYSLTSE